MSLDTVLGETPGAQIIRLIQHNGTVGIKELEASLGVTTGAVRHQLGHLLAEGLIAKQSVHGGVGRPKDVYHLTEKGQKLFPRDYDEFLISLLEEILTLYGKEGLHSLLNSVGMSMARKYLGQITGEGISDRLSQLIVLLNQKGMLAELNQIGEELTFKVFSCPYHELVQDHREICEMEQEMMTRVLNADVELSECMMDGSECCDFSVK